MFYSSFYKLIGSIKRKWTVAQKSMVPRKVDGLWSNLVAECEQSGTIVDRPMNHRTFMGQIRRSFDYSRRSINIKT